MLWHEVTKCPKIVGMTVKADLPETRCLIRKWGDGQDRPDIIKRTFPMKNQCRVWEIGLLLESSFGIPLIEFHPKIQS
jgi:hypothetical protein